MSVKYNPNKPRFIPEALWLLDWQCMGSLLDEAAIQKLEQAGWAIFFAQISETGKQPMLSSGRSRAFKVTGCSGKSEEFFCWSGVG